MSDDLVKRLRDRAEIRKQATADQKNKMLFVVAQESVADAKLMYESSDYIEYLEAKLQLANMQHDSYTAALIKRANKACAF